MNGNPPVSGQQPQPIRLPDSIHKCSIASDENRASVAEMTHERSVPLRTAASIAGAVLLAIVALALHPHTSGHPAALV